MRYAPINITIDDNHNKNIWCKCVLTEGKNREIRKIFNHFDIMVNRLIRTKYGPYNLNDIPPGKILHEVRLNSRDLPDKENNLR
jgi:23S rRNA pseudouridine2605 synthase